jgi:hypothetical protein
MKVMGELCFGVAQRLQNVFIHGGKIDVMKSSIRKFILVHHQVKPKDYTNESPNLCCVKELSEHRNRFALI